MSRRDQTSNEVVIRKIDIRMHGTDREAGERFARSLSERLSHGLPQVPNEKVNTIRVTVPRNSKNVTDWVNGASQVILNQLKGV